MRDRAEIQQVNRSKDGLYLDNSGGKIIDNQKFGAGREMVPPADKFPVHVQSYSPCRCIVDKR